MTEAAPESERPEPLRPGPDHEDENEFGVSPELVNAVRDDLDDGRIGEVEAVVSDLHAADLADLVEQIGPEHRGALIDILRPQFDGEIFAYLSQSLREMVLDQLEPREIAAAVAELESDDAIDLIEDLDADQQREILENLPPETRALVEEGLTFPEYSAGRLMSRDLVSVPQFWTVGKTLDYLRTETDNLPEDFYDIFIVDPMHKVVGAIPLSRIMRQKRSVKVGDILTEDIRTITATTDQEEVAFLFRQYGLVSAPVVDGNGRLLGVITVDDVVDVIDEEAEDDLLKLSGVPDTDIYRAVLDTTRSRFTWLFINLLTAILASSVIALFEATIEQIVALAVLMPIVASMGGNAGTQTLTVTVRALAMRELSNTNAVRVVAKEALVGTINGTLFAVIIGLVAGFWFQDHLLGIVIASAMIINLFIAGLCGTLIPLGLARLKIDPAVASAVFLTTVTDVVGFFAFLGLAALILM
ncbi:magnesium transporter [Skermanella stibiiresistens SB22]|uniref:Magnesium transporter MgtE n=1 Tax=Skermanella stibiiresistens SB22 TaxID=1385369 RepID=W9GQ78_9PROT|nr:magnesium transporter [Skermanella stibiiresistens]EWY36060.1 magnesium transporter [Skermanella stibiiresistens SB22]